MFNNLYHTFKKNPDSMPNQLYIMIINYLLKNIIISNFRNISDIN